MATSYNELSYHGRLPAGTPGYAAPETLSANPEWTPQADIYSATICVIETLLGSQPGHNWPDELLRLGHSKRLVAELRVGTENAPSERHPSIEAWGERIRFALGQQARPWARWAVFAVVAATVAASLAALSAYAVRSDEILTGRPPPLLAEDGFERCASSDEACPAAPEIVVRVTNQLELEVNHDGIGNTYRLEAQGEIVEVTNGGRFSYGAFRYPSATDPDPHERWTAEQLSLRVWACSTAGCTPSRAFVGVLGESDGQGADVTCLLNPGLQEAHCLIRDTNQTESPASMQAFDTLYTCDEQEAGFLVPDGYGEGRLYLGCQVYLSDVRALDFRAVGHDDNSGDLVFGPEVSLLPS